MTWQTLLLFIGSTFFVSATPGANMLYAFQMGLNHGLRKTLFVMAGLSVGLLILLVLALVGLGVLSQYPIVLMMIKLLGAGYLLYLGVSVWREHGQLQQNGQVPVLSSTKLFQSGIWVSLSNPKAILFFAAFFPKFLNFKADLMLQYVILTIAFFVIETLWQLIYAVGGIKLAAWLNFGHRMMYLNRACGVVFVVIAMMLVVDIF